MALVPAANGVRGETRGCAGVFLLAFGESRSDPVIVHLRKGHIGDVGPQCAAPDAVEGDIIRSCEHVDIVIEEMQVWVVVTVRPNALIRFRFAMAIVAVIARDEEDVTPCACSISKKGLVVTHRA